MEFSITQESSLEGDKSEKIIELSESLKQFFCTKFYGSDVEHFYIGLICVKPEGEMFFKIRKPRYKVVEKIKLFDGSEKELKGVYSYDVKIDFKGYTSLPDAENKKYIASEILQSLTNLDTLPKRIKDFDKESFKTDIKRFFKEQRLL